MRALFGRQKRKDSAGLQSGSSAVFVVESPFQVLSAIEAKHFYGFENNILLVKYTVRKERKRNRDQIFKAVELDDWDSVIVWRTGIGFWKTKALVDYLQFRRIGIQLKSKCEVLFLGEFRCASMHRMRSLLKPVQTVILDDGAASIWIQRDYLLQGKFKYQGTAFLKRRSNLGRLLYNRYDTDPILENRLRIFTCFPNPVAVNEGVTSVCNFRFLRNRLRLIKCKQNAVFYFGSKYSERGIICRQYELLFLQEVYAYYRYSAKTREIYYVSHRDDSPEKVRAIEKLGFIIKEYEETAEVAMIKEVNRPARIGSAYSTVMSTLPILFPQLTFDSFVIPLENVAQEYREGVRSAYEFYESQGISLLDWVDGQFVERTSVSESAEPVESTS